MAATRTLRSDGRHHEAYGFKMITNYYTLRALVNEWKPRLSDARLTGAWSQARGECTIHFDVPAPGGQEDWSLKISVQAPLRYLFMNPGTSRARKNVADAFQACNGAIVEAVAIAENDRVVDLVFRDGRSLRILPFGPRANIYLVDTDGMVLDRFRQQGAAPGEQVPEIRLESGPGMDPSSITEALRGMEGRLDRRVRSCFPSLNRDLAVEVCARANLDPDSDAPVSEDGLHELSESVSSVLSNLIRPSARIYWEDEDARMFSLISLSACADLRAEPFETVDEAARIYSRRMLRQTIFARRHEPLVRIVSARLEHATRSRDRMEEELRKESRADQYEHWGHLLMACQRGVPEGVDSVELDDIVSGTGRISIPLRSEMNAVRNAERFYEKARDTRRTRASSAERLERLEILIRRMAVLSKELSGLDSAADVDRFRKSHREFLAELSSQGTGAEPDIPFRQYELKGGYSVWVGRNAKQNDRLTLKFARKFDLWLHARGVGGSHTVLRLPGRNHRPPAAIIEQAAEIAAYYSKARTSSLAPVTVTERRYVRKPRKSLPGTVIVEREEVLMVTPRLPGSAGKK